MNSSHFIIRVVGIFIGQGAKAPLGPNKAPPLVTSSLSCLFLGIFLSLKVFTLYIN